MATAIGGLLALVGYMQYREAQLNRQYQQAKLEAKLKQSQSVPKRVIVVNSDTSSDEDQQPHSDTDTHSSGKVGKDEIAKAEGVMRSNSSYVDMSPSGSQSITKRMKDDTLDHSKVLSQSKHPITRICLTGGPCAGKTTALATLSTVL